MTLAKHATFAVLGVMNTIFHDQARIQLLTKGVVVIMSCRRRHKAHQWGVLATLLVGCVVPPLYR